ncbi:PEPxxWA-CTERM sorting domain-containing protein [Sphingomonas sp. TREG-RG-20F-R18-01]|uniref:PEPxxWA-CTERM sorting domain-containing protein n=1 Tax=Sphingomonas sp. TREG-RG-20F-R18-01 TaxID=2914982 RepID=UPI001F5A0FFD|nr:PEPxxWA-CTERM sorting domain-containing protein [Sphingomonas sp. TREG-RG-20F-R18-01]
MSVKPYLASLALASSMLAGPANAAVTMSFNSTGSSPTTGFTVIDTFTTLAGLAITGSVQIKTPPADPSGAPPANSSPSGTSYLSVLAGGAATYTFASPVTGVQFDWGSVDTYNTLTLRGSFGTMTIVPGTTPNPAFPSTNGNQGFTGSGLFTALGSGDTFTSITFGSSSNSFEVDNLAVRSAVPEPASWAMMLAGFGLVGFGLRHRTARARRLTYA